MRKSYFAAILVVMSILIGSAYADDNESPSWVQYRSEVKALLEKQALSLWNKPHSILTPACGNYKHATHIMRLDNNTVSFRWDRRQIIVSMPFVIMEECP